MTSSAWPRSASCARWCRRWWRPTPRGSWSRWTARALRAFLRYATTDAQRALRKPANDEVVAIEEVVRDAEPGPDTEIPPRRGESVRPHRGEFLRGTERDLQPIWPDLAKRLATLRDDL